MNIAHYFTVIRIFIIPFFSFLYLKYQYLHISQFLLPFLLFVLLLICELTDLIDGFLARRRNQVTDVGKVLDPMADSITHIVTFFTFTQGWISLPLLLVFIFLYREFLIGSLRTVCALKGCALSARRSGKIKSLIQAIVSLFIIALMVPYTWGIISLNVLQKVSFYSVMIAAAYSIYSAIEYIIANRSYLKKTFFASD